MDPLLMLLLACIVFFSVTKFTNNSLIAILLAIMVILCLRRSVEGAAGNEGSGCSWNNCESCKAKGAWCDDETKCTDKKDCGGQWCNGTCKAYEGPPDPDPDPDPDPGPAPPCMEGIDVPDDQKKTPEEVIKYLGLDGGDTSEKLKVIYLDVPKEQCLTDIIEACNAGYNIINLAFYSGGKAEDYVLQWERSNVKDKQKVKEYLRSKNALLMISFGGAYQCPNGCDNPQKLNKKTGKMEEFKFDGGCTQHGWPNCAKSQVMDSSLCDFQYDTKAPTSTYLKDNLYDGLDLDLENFSPGTDKSNCTGKLTTYIDKLKGAIPGLVISSAPQSPHFHNYSLNFKDKSLVSKINFFNVQFYNNDGPTCGQNTIDWLFNKDAKTSDRGANNIQKLIEFGIPKSKIVAGKCGQGCPVGDAIQGGLPPNQAHMGGKTLLDNLDGIKGVMYWEWNTGNQLSGDNWLKSTNAGCNPTY